MHPTSRHSICRQFCLYATRYVESASLWIAQLQGEHPPGGLQNQWVAPRGLHDCVDGLVQLAWGFRGRAPSTDANVQGMVNGHILARPLATGPVRGPKALMGVSRGHTGTLHIMLKHMLHL